MPVLDRRFAYAACGALVALAPLAACESLDEFRTGDDHVLRGEVIGSGDETSSFIRAGFASHTVMDLTFDPSLAEAGLASGSAKGASVSPGTVHTYTCKMGAAPCRSRDRVPGEFAHAALEPIENLEHDTLSQYDFPGGGRVKNYMFGARFSGDVDGAAVARHAMVFVSLMETGRVEVRVIAPSVLDAAGEHERLPALFGVFMLDMDAR